MIEGSGGELQQLVQEDEGEEPLPGTGDTATPVNPPRATLKNDVSHSHVASQQASIDSNVQVSPVMSKTSSGQATTSQGSMVSGRVGNPFSNFSNQPRISYLNEKEKTKSKSDNGKVYRQHRATTTCKHHSFLSEVPDVRRMEQALLQLLEDFHSGNLRAFGKDCSMEQMTEIREQQERLARLHFELGQRQDPNISMDAGFRQSSTNMRHLLQRLQQLSVCIEKLHSK